jgi:glycerol-3-phosphate acyltransferase PlsY
VRILSVILISYLIGSVPFGYIAGRLAGIDIRTVGSGNVGATNVVRTLGRAIGYPVFLLDFLKGAAAVGISLLISRHSPVEIGRDLGGILAGACAVVGHVFPVWLRFKGGKGVATSVGVIFALMPLVACMIGLVWIVVFQVTRYVSVASIAAAIAMPIATAAMIFLRKTQAPVLFYFSVALAILIIVRHWSNVSRLRTGTEQRFRGK